MFVRNYMHYHSELRYLFDRLNWARSWIGQRMRREKLNSLLTEIHCVEFMYREASANKNNKKTLRFRIKELMTIDILIGTFLLAVLALRADW